MKSIFFLWIFLSLWMGTNAQKANSHGDVNRNNTTNNVFRPQASYPSNKSIVFLPNPIFIWMPPPTAGGSLVTYSIRLVKVQEGQTPEEALLQNPALLNLSGLTNTFLSYPIDAPPLENNGQYAWQVTASSAAKSFGQADISLFFVQKPDSKETLSKNASLDNNDDSQKPDNKQKSDSNAPQKPTNKQTANIAQKPDNNTKNDFEVFPVATTVSDGHFYLTNGIIRLAYLNKANDKNLTYTIKALDKNQNLSTLPSVAISPGMNKLAINLQHNTGLEENKYYDLEITDSKGQVYTLLYYYITQ